MGAATEAVIAITAGAGGLMTKTVLDSLSKTLSSRRKLERSVPRLRRTSGPAASLYLRTLESTVPRLRRKSKRAASLRITTSNGTIELSGWSPSSIDIEKLSLLLQTEQERAAAERVVEDYLAQVEDTGQVNS